MHKDDFTILFFLDKLGYIDPEQISGELRVSLSHATKKLVDLESKKLLEIEQKEDSIFSSKITPEGKELLSNPDYKVWKFELENKI